LNPPAVGAARGPQGADVTASDLSPQFLELVSRVAARHGVSVGTELLDAERLDFPDGTFDVVHAANVLHHADMDRTLDEIARVLKPDGVLVSWDPLRHNPVVSVYFTIWIVMTLLFWRLSPRPGDTARADRAATLSGPGLVLLVLTVTFAAVDWIMSLEPEFVSSIWGVYFIGGALVSSPAAVILACCSCRTGPRCASRRPPTASTIWPSCWAGSSCCGRTSPSAGSCWSGRPTFPRRSRSTCTASRTGGGG
jgi:SAM-dependent methyltransferase